MLCLAAVLWSIGWLTSCKKLDDEDGCKISYESPVDGGLKCGEHFSFEGEPGERAVFGIKAAPYVNIDLAGVVSLDTVAVVLVLMEGAQENLDLDLSVKICHVEFPRIEVPGQPDPAFLDLVPAAYDALEPVPVDGWLTGDQTCDSMATESAVFVLGARLEDDGMGPLPKDTLTESCVDDSDMDCIYDLEEDGYPGTTMITDCFPVLDIRHLEVVMRTVVSLSGLMVSQDRIIGGVDMQLDIGILGCRIWDAQHSVERICTKEEERVVKGMRPMVTQLYQPESPFVAIRLDPDVTCEDLRREAQYYFGH